MKHLLKCTLLMASMSAMIWQTPVQPAMAAQPLKPMEHAAQQNAPRKLPTNTLILRYRGDVNLVGDDAPDRPRRMDRLSQAVGATVVYVRPLSGGGHVLALPARLDEDQVKAIADRIAQLVPDVEFVEPDRVMMPDLVPNDPNYGLQWHLGSPISFGTNVTGAWDITTGSNTVVAVIDTGILFNHPDLSNTRVLAGYDFISDGDNDNDATNGRDGNAADPGDWVTATESASGPLNGCPVSSSSWHGTHVAGLIGAISNNGQNTAGINWNVRILPVRVLGKCGGKTSDIVDGIRWAAGLHINGVPDNTTPAKVINLSLGGSGDCSGLFNSYKNAITDARNAGAIVVVSAGNNNGNASTQEPASCDDVITVAATDQAGNKASFSNFGALVDIAAPGVGVWSLGNTGTQGPVSMSTMSLQGTSQAAPHVAGIISLALAVRPSLGQTQLLDLIQATATDFPSGSSCTATTCGPGIINALPVVRDIWVNRAANPLVPFGTPSWPYTSLGLAYVQAWDGSQLKIAAGNYNEHLTLSKKITLTATNGIVVIGQ